MKPRVILKKQDRFNYIMDGVVDYYKTTPEEIKKWNKSPEKHDRKRVLVKVLKDYGDLSYKEIAYGLGFSNVAARECYLSLTYDLPCLRFKELRNTYNEVIKHLGI